MSCTSASKTPINSNSEVLILHEQGMIECDNDDDDVDDDDDNNDNNRMLWCIQTDHC
jgi:hypothetical protein